MLRTTFLTLLLLGPAVAAAQTPPAPTADTPKAQRMASDDVQALLDAGKVFFLDVREPHELEELGTLDGYVNIPLGQSRSGSPRFPATRPSSPLETAVGALPVRQRYSKSTATP